MGLRLLKMMLVALLALVLGYVAALGVGLVVFEVFEVSQREGANAMGLAFVICPFVAVISAVIAAIWYWISSGRRAATTSPTAVETRRGNAVRVFAIAVSVVVGWLAGTLLQWLLIGMIILGGATWWLTRRRKALTS
jgi:hypothetical protein